MDKRRLGLIPVPALIALIAVLYLSVKPSVVYEPSWLIPITNTLFISVVSLIVSYIAMRNYMATGRVQIILLGCGVLIFGLGGAVAGFVRYLPEGANLNVTVYNTGALAGALFHFAAALMLLAGTSPETGSKQKGTWLVLGYCGVALFMALLTAAALRGVIPAFFIQGVGPTLLRQEILGAALILFIFSFIIFMGTFLRNREGFLYWYSLALALTAISLAAFFIESSVGSPVGWAGRLSQYIGGVYFLVALVAGKQSPYAAGASFDNVLTRALTSAEEKIRRHHAILDGMNRIFREALTCETEEQLGQMCLKVVEEVTESKFAFIGETGEDGLLHDVAISDPGWQACAMHDRAGRRRAPGNFKMHGLYGKVVNDEKPFYTNDPATHPDSIGVPAGHPPLKAFLGVPLTHAGKTIGMIGAANREGGYGGEEVAALERLSAAIVQAFMHYRAGELIRDSLREKDTLLKELYHRTKNNMNVISAFMRLQMNQIEDPSVKQLFQDGQNRIQAMALVHEMLYRTKELSRLDLKEYLERLARSILAGHKTKDITLRFDMHPVPVSLYTATPVGLILNELLSNSIKHAFPGSNPGEIAIGLKTREERVVLSYSDNGVGLPGGFRIEGSSSLGLRLVDGLARKQLMGELEIRSGNGGGGMRVVISFGTGRLDF